MELAPGTVIEDRYVVQGVLGRGAMAVVYLVRHRALGTSHALKVLHLPTWSVRDRLLKEGRFQSSLKDPFVVTVSDVVDVEGSPGLVMDRVRGPSLEHLLQHTRLAVPEARALGAGVLRGVRAAHRVGLVHRDLKPANVLIEVSADGLQPKIADFGLAKLLEPEADGAGATRSGTSLGTPAYMAPEQIRNARSVDERADVFSLGALLYELCTGVRAFPGDDLLEVFDRIREARYRPIAELAPAVPAEMADAVAGALEPDRDRRIGSVAELLDRWTGGLGETAAEHDWPVDLVETARGLAGDVTGRSGETLEPFGETFDAGALDLAPRTSPIASGFSETPGPSSRIGDERPAVPRGSRARWWLAGTLLGLGGGAALAGALAFGLVGVALSSDWLEWGEAAPESKAAGYGMYTAGHAPPLPDGSPEQLATHERAWRDLHAGRFEAAVIGFSEVVAGQKVAPPLLRVADATARLAADEPGAGAALQRALAGAPGGGPTFAREAVAGIEDAAARERLKLWLHRNSEEALGPLLVGALEGWPTDTRIEVLQAATERDPEGLGARVMLAELLLRRGRVAEAAEQVDRGLALDPEHERLLAARVRVALERGEGTEARRIADRLPADRRRPGSVGRYAASLVVAGDDAVAEKLAEVLTEPSLAAAARLGRAEALLGLGHDRDARALLDQGFAAARDAGLPITAAEFVRLQATWALVVDRPEDLAAAAARAREAAGLPGVPEIAARRLQGRAYLLDGLAGLHEGREPDAELLGLGGADGVRLAAMIRVARGVRDGAAAEDLPVADLELATGGPSSCVGLLLRARWLGEAGDPATQSRYSDVIRADEPCGRFGIDRYVRAAALAELAPRVAADGDTALARRQLQEFGALLPDPDDDLPAVQRMLRLQEDLAFGGP